jgi:hypothetical protein
MLCFSVDRSSHESPYVEPDLNEVWVLGQGIGEARGRLGVHPARANPSHPSRDSAGHAQSMRLRARGG